MERPAAVGFPKGCSAFTRTLAAWGQAAPPSTAQFWLRAALQRANVEPASAAMGECVGAPHLGLCSAIRHANGEEGGQKGLRGAWFGGHYDEWHPVWAVFTAGRQPRFNSGLKPYLILKMTAVVPGYLRLTPGIIRHRTNKVGIFAKN